MNSSLPFGFLWNLSHSEGMEILRQFMHRQGTSRPSSTPRATAGQLPYISFFRIRSGSLVDTTEKRCMPHPRLWAEVGYTRHRSSEAISMAITTVYNSWLLILLSSRSLLPNYPFLPRPFVTLCTVQIASDKYSQCPIFSFATPTDQQILRES
jgi:hypothetical protein